MSSPDLFFLAAPFDDPDLLQTITGAPDPVLASAADPEGGTGGLWSPRDAQSRARLAFYAEVHGAGPHAGTALREGQTKAVQVIRLGPDPLAGRRFSPPLTPLWQDIWREAASEIMDAFGHQPGAVLCGRLNQIWARAASRIRARGSQRAPFGALTRDNLTILSRDRPYAKFFTVEDYRLSHDRFDGTRSGPLDRAVLVSADAVTVLPYDPVRDRVLVVEQIRPGPVARGDPAPWVPEPVAGRIEPGQSPEDTAHRETLEEAGVVLTALHPVAEYYPTPAAMSEYLYSYVGIADLPDTAAGLGGLESEAEDIRSHILPRARLMALIQAGRMPVGTLLLSAFWLELNHARLRASG